MTDPLVITPSDAATDSPLTMRQYIARYSIDYNGLPDSIDVEAFLIDFVGRTKLAPLLHGEPVFVLRAADKIAPSLVLAWANDAARHDVPIAKSGGAQRIAYDMLAWQIANPGLVKVPD
jgi:hypothetical protein